jgi:hypothetical protein
VTLPEALQRIAVLEQMLHEETMDHAYTLNEHHRAVHELKSAATAVRCSQRLADSYKAHRDRLLAERGQVQACQGNCAREAA